MKRSQRIGWGLVFGLLCVGAGRAQFYDSFDAGKIDGWFTMAGDGVATIELCRARGSRGWRSMGRAIRTMSGGR